MVHRFLQVYRYRGSTENSQGTTVQAEVNFTILLQSVNCKRQQKTHAPDPWSSMPHRKSSTIFYLLPVEHKHHSAHQTIPKLNTCVGKVFADTQCKGLRDRAGFNLTICCYSWTDWMGFTLSNAFKVIQILFKSFLKPLSFTTSSPKSLLPEHSPSSCCFSSWNTPSRPQCRRALTRLDY